MFSELMLVLALLGILVVAVAIGLALQSNSRLAVLRRLSGSAQKGNLKDIVDSILVIAIPKREDYIKSTLKTYGLTLGDFELVKPVMTADIPATQVPSYMRAGEVACFQSHMKALQQFLESSNKTALIFEDDLKPCPNYTFFQQRVGSLKEELHRIQRWDIIYFGRCNDTCMLNKKVSKQLVSGTIPLCLHAYMMSREGARKVLQAAGERVRIQVDVLFVKMIATGQLKALAVNPSIFYQNKDVETTLGNPRELRECLLDNHDYYLDQR